MRLAAACCGREVPLAVAAKADVEKPGADPASSLTLRFAACVAVLTAALGALLAAPLVLSASGG